MIKVIFLYGFLRLKPLSCLWPHGNGVQKSSQLGNVMPSRLFYCSQIFKTVHGKTHCFLFILSMQDINYLFEIISPKNIWFLVRYLIKTWQHMALAPRFCSEINLFNCQNPNSTSTQLKRWVWHENDFTPPPPTNTHHHHPPQQTECQLYLSCSWPDLNQTLKEGVWDQQQQHQ